MRANVLFSTDAFSTTDPLPEAIDFDQALGGDAAYWLIERLPDGVLRTDPKPCQEDWGWEVFVRHPNGRFWVGVTPLFDATESRSLWIMHIHHWGLNVLQRVTTRGRKAMVDVALAIDRELKADERFADIRWYRQHDLNRYRMEMWASSPSMA